MTNATTTATKHPSGDHTPRPCARCGVMRQTRTGRGPICADCRYVLTQAERKLWAA